MSKNRINGQWSMVNGLKPKICFVLVLIISFSVLSFAQEQFKYDTGGRRDPFIPLVTPDGRLLKLDTVSSKGALAIEGIIYDPNGLSYAIVKGDVVKIGDIVDGNRVLKIGKNKIVFIKEDKVFEVELKEEGAK